MAREYLRDTRVGRAGMTKGQWDRSENKVMRGGLCRVVGLLWKGSWWGGFCNSAGQLDRGGYDKCHPLESVGALYPWGGVGC